MSVFTDTKETAARFQNYIDEFIKLFRQHGLPVGAPRNVFALIGRLARDWRFRDELKKLGNSVLRREGGKLSLGVLFTIIAIAIGGIGIAGMGSAVGVPAALLASILGALGFGIGQEVDEALASSGESAGVTDSAFEVSTTIALSEMLDSMNEDLLSLQRASESGNAKLDQLLGNGFSLEQSAARHSREIASRLELHREVLENHERSLAKIKSLLTALLILMICVAISIGVVIFLIIEQAK